MVPVLSAAASRPSFSARTQGVPPAGCWQTTPQRERQNPFPSMDRVGRNSFPALGFICCFSVSLVNIYEIVSIITIILIIDNRATAVNA